MEAMFDRGWTDGLPVVPPTEARVLRMLEGTDPAARRGRGGGAPRPGGVHGREGRRQRRAWPAAAPSTCRSCWPRSRRPAPTSSTSTACWPPPTSAGPVIMVNGPIAAAIGMNSGVNALGQGNRANATIGRALQLIMRNVGGGRPGGIDRATLGNPGKYTFCFAEDEAGSPWESLAVERGFAPDAVHGHPVRRRGPAAASSTSSPATRSRWPGRSPPACAGVAHPKLALGFDAVLVVCPDHGRVFREAGWDKARLRERAGRAAGPPRRPRSPGAPAASPRACPTSWPGPRCPSSVTAGCSSCTPAAAPACSVGHRGLDVRVRREPTHHQGGTTMTPGGPRTETVVLDPTGERVPAQRQRARSAGVARRRSPSACSTSPSPAATCSSTGSRAARGSGPRVERFAQADVHQAGPHRPAPRDLHPVRRRHRGARRLRELHVVQCARHRRSREPRACRACSSPPPSSSTRPRPRPTHRLPSRRRSSSPTRSRTAPTTRCGPWPTTPSTTVLAALTDPGPPAGPDASSGQRQRSRRRALHGQPVAHQRAGHRRRGRDRPAIRRRRPSCAGSSPTAAPAARSPAGRDPGGPSPRSGDWPALCAGRAAGGSGRRPPGPAPRAHAGGRPGRTRTGRRPGAAHGGAEVEHRLVPGPALPGRHRGVGQALHLGRPEANDPRGPGQDPRRVGVDHADVALEGEGQHGPGGVRARSRAGPRARSRSSGTSPS